VPEKSFKKSTAKANNKLLIYAKNTIQAVSSKKIYYLNFLNAKTFIYENFYS